MVGLTVSSVYQIEFSCVRHFLSHYFFGILIPWLNDSHSGLYHHKKDRFKAWIFAPFEWKYEKVGNVLLLKRTGPRSGVSFFKNAGGKGYSDFLDKFLFWWLAHSTYFNPSFNKSVNVQDRTIYGKILSKLNLMIDQEIASGRRLYMWMPLS